MKNQNIKVIINNNIVVVLVNNESIPVDLYISQFGNTVINFTIPSPPIEFSEIEWQQVA